MSAHKRTPAERDLDRQWIVERASEGLGPAAIKRRAAEAVAPADFEHIADANERHVAVVNETARRKSVNRISDRQIGYDLRLIRARALEAGDKTYRKILERTIRELARIGFADLRSVLEWGPNGVTIRDCWELNEAEAATVAGVTWKTTTRTVTGEQGPATETTTEARLDTHSKTQALRDLLRHLGGYLSIQLPLDSEDADDVIDRLVERLTAAEAPDKDEATGGSA